MTYCLEDIRQSSAWGKYLEQWGWESYATDTGIILRTIETNRLIVGKIQRPKALNQKDIDGIKELTKDYTFVKIEPAADQDLRLLETNGMLPSKNPLTPTKTLVIDLTKNLGQLYSEISRSAKYSINRAKREQYTAELADSKDKAAINEFAQIHAESAQVKGSKKFLAEEILRMIESFGDKAYIIFSKDSQGTVCAANLYLGHTNCVWYILGGTTNFGRSTKGGYLLYWESFKLFQQLGYQWLDLDGVQDDRFANTASWKGFSDFKKKFGGETIEFAPPYVLYSKKWIRFFHKIINF